MRVSFVVDKLDSMHLCTETLPLTTSSKKAIQTVVLPMGGSVLEYEGFHQSLQAKVLHRFRETYNFHHAVKGLWISVHMGEGGGDMCPLCYSFFDHFSCFIFTVLMGQVLLSFFHSLENGGSVKWSVVWKATDSLDVPCLISSHPSSAPSSSIHILLV